MDILRSGRLNILQMEVLPKWTTVNAISTRTTAGFAETDKLTLKFIWTLKRPRIADLEKKILLEDSHFPISSYYKATVIKIVTLKRHTTQ